MKQPRAAPMLKLWVMALLPGTLAALGGGSAVQVMPAARPAPVPGSSRPTLALQVGHSDYIHCIAFSPDGKTLATGSKDRTVRLWDARSREVKAVLWGHTAPVVALAFSPDGTTLASLARPDGSQYPGEVTSDGEVLLWEAATGRPGRRLDGRELWLPARTLAFSPDGTMLAALSNGLRLWDVTSGRLKHVLKHQDGDTVYEVVESVAFSPDGERVATAAGKRVWLWDSKSGHLRARLSGHADEVKVVRFSSDGKLLASGGGAGESGDVKLWNAADGTLAASLSNHPFPVTALSFSADGSALATGSVWTGRSSQTRVWEVKTGRLQFATAGEAPVFAADGRTLKTTNSGSATLLWDRRSGRIRAALPDAQHPLVFSTDGRLLASGVRTYPTGGSAHPSREARVWDAASGELKIALRECAGTVTRMVFQPGGSLLATVADPDLLAPLPRGMTPKIVQLWDLASGQGVLTATLPEHVASIQAIAFSPDGKTLATGGSRADGAGEARLWEVPSGRPRAVLPGHAAPVGALAFAPDGSLLATASASDAGADAVRLWDARSGALKATLQGSRGWITTLTFSPDGRMLLAGGGIHEKTDGGSKVKGGEAWLWETASGRSLARLSGHPSLVRTGAFSPDGRTVATGGDEARLWDTATGRLKATLPGHARWISFSADGKSVTTGDGEAIRTWQIEPLQEIQTDPTGSEILSPDGETLASVSHGNLLQLADGGTGKPRAFLRATGPEAFSPDGRTLATAGSETAQLWDAESGLLTATLKGHPHRVSPHVFSADGKTLAVGSETGMARVWDLEAGRLISTLRGHTGLIGKLALSPDGKMLAACRGGLGGEVDVPLWEVGTGRLRALLKGHNSSVTGLAFSPDSRTLATVGYDQTVRIWNVATGRQRMVLPEKTSYVERIAFSPDGRRLVTGSGKSRNGEAVLWDAASGRRVARLEGVGGDELAALAFSPDGRTLLTADSSGVARLWEGRTGRLKATLEGQGAISTLAFSTDSRLLAMGRESLHAEVWDVATGRSRARFHLAYTIRDAAGSVQESGLAGAATTLAFSGDGKRLVARDAAGNIRAWDIETRQQEAVTHPLLGGLPVSMARPVTVAGGAVSVRDPLTAEVRVTMVALPEIEAPGRPPAGHVSASTGAGEWLVITHDGYLEGSGNAAHFIRWNVNGVIQPAGTYMEQLRRPDRVRAALRFGQ